MNIDYKLIGGRIKRARKICNMTQEALAEKLDVSIGYVSQVERGITKISLDLLGAVSTILHCDVATLVTGSAMDFDSYMETELLEEIHTLSKEQRRFLLKMILAMREET